MQTEATVGAGPTPKGRPRRPEIEPPAGRDTNPPSLSLRWQAQIAGMIGALGLVLMTVATLLGWMGALALIVGLTAARWT
jgi:hypothetical protein